MLGGMNTDQRKAKPTAENKEESARLRDLWERRKATHKMSQGGFGHDFDIGNQSAVGHFLSGRNAISLKAAFGFARGLECWIADFSPRLANEAVAIAKLASNDAPVGWPFTDELLSAIHRLPLGERLKMENSLRMLVELPPLISPAADTGNDKAA